LQPGKRVDHQHPSDDAAAAAAAAANNIMLDAEHAIIDGLLRLLLVPAQTDLAFDFAEFSLALTEAIDIAGAEFVDDLPTSRLRR
jgi:hypothetical protein